MRIALFLASCVLALPCQGEIEGRWGGQGTFPGWPSIFCVLDFDGERSTLSTLPAQLVDQPITGWESSGETFSFEVDVHGTVFDFKGTRTGDSISGSIHKEGEDSTGSMALIPYPVVSAMPNRNRWSSALDVTGVMEIPMILDTATGTDGRIHVDLSIPSQQLIQFPLEVIPGDDGLVRMTLHAGAGAAVFETRMSDEELAANTTENHGNELDEDVERWSGGVLERIADCITGHGSLVSIRTLAAMMIGLDVLLGVVPCTTGVGHVDGQGKAACKSTDKESHDSSNTEDQTNDDGRNDCKQ